MASALRTLRIALLATVGASSAACSMDFTPFTRVEIPRILALRSDDPQPQPPASITLDALVYVPPDRTEEPTYRWRFCPFASSGADGFECLISEDDIEQIATDNGFPIPDGLLTFELGSEETAVFPALFDDALLQLLCEQLTGSAVEDTVGEIPDFVTLPDCDGIFPVLVRLDLTVGTESVSAVRELGLRYDGGALTYEAHTNPILRPNFRFVRGDDADCRGAPDTGPLARNITYTVCVDIPAGGCPPTFEGGADCADGERLDVSEAFTDPDSGEAEREGIVLTWFSEAGDFDATRTIYLPGEFSVADAQSNDWDIPSVEDYDRSTSELFVVVRDGRGGFGWVSTSVEFAP